MNDSSASSSPSPLEIPPPSSSPDLQPAPAPPAGQVPASSSRAAAGRRKSTRKTTRKKTAVASSPPRPAPRPQEPKLELDPAEVRKVLAGLGDVLHLIAVEALAVDEDVAPNLCRFTDDELDDLSPPLARLIARHRVLAHLCKASDELVVATTIGRYVVRNVFDARLAAQITEQRYPEPPQEVENEVDGQTRDVVGDARSQP